MALTEIDFEQQFRASAAFITENAVSLNLNSWLWAVISTMVCQRMYC